MLENMYSTNYRWCNTHSLWKLTPAPSNLRQSLPGC